MQQKGLERQRGPLRSHALIAAGSVGGAGWRKNGKVEKEEDGKEGID